MKTTGISKKGILFLLLGIGLFSTVEICQKLINKNNAIDPNMMVFIRFVVTGVLLLAFGLPSYFSRGGRLTMRDWGVFAFNGFFGIALSLGFFHFGINMFRNASSSAVVFSANAVFAIVIARFMNKEEWNCRKWLATLLGLGGVCLFMFESGRADLSTLKAVGVMSVAAMLFALSVCFTKRVVSKYGAMVYMGGSSLIGGFLSLPLVFLTSSKGIVAEFGKVWDALPEMTYMVVVATALAYVFYYSGIAATSAYIGSMAFFLKPPLACIFAQIARVTGLLKNEKMMNAWTISGTVLIVIAMCLAVLKTDSKKTEG
ncbi:MAG: EamA family transporter [Lentisphaerae bacterium]|jgi:drug/metabolite transporter (DMT)-like permease|nr:EamA family transporter [Lentisphaerota bacterium]